MRELSKKHKLLLLSIFIIGTIVVSTIILGVSSQITSESSDIDPKRISGKDSFYLSGTLMVYGILLMFFSVMNLIALF